ncbi:hypothetical protein OG239_41780 [Streptomyces sp. NBC_00868]|uniref:hypothetical protein n=1 Tax=unclassified Streptomyces TaxID=2593676 RepID=UPI00325395DF|nr:hypothetical protein OG239_41780 [Streptomyces sp. NBC_00868]
MEHVDHSEADQREESEYQDGDDGELTDRMRQETLPGWALDFDGPHPAMLFLLACLF